MKLSIHFFGLLFLVLFFSCSEKLDSEKIIGKWQNEQDWFEYSTKGTYNSGKSFLTIIKEYKYSVDEEKNELVMYTNNENETYYLVYEFIGNDTLAIRNSLSTNKKWIKYYRATK